MSAPAPTTIDTVEELRAAVARGVTFSFRFFWRPTGDPRRPPDDSCFSQWWASDFVVDGIAYTSAEQWMMAGKARLFGDAEMLARILAAHDPAAVMKLGRAVRNFDGSVWKASRDALVTRGNIAKFSARPDLRSHLLGTGDAVLVEASPKDRIWGIGLHASDPLALDPSRWRGENRLGFALMRTRMALSAAV